MPTSALIHSLAKVAPLLPLTLAAPPALAPQSLSSSEISLGRPSIAAASHKAQRKRLLSPRLLGPAPSSVKAPLGPRRLSARLAAPRVLRALTSAQPQARGESFGCRKSKCSDAARGVITATGDALSRHSCVLGEAPPLGAPLADSEARLAIAGAARNLQSATGGIFDAHRDGRWSMIVKVPLSAEAACKLRVTEVAQPCARARSGLLACHLCSLPSLLEEGRLQRRFASDVASLHRSPSSRS